MRIELRKYVHDKKWKVAETHPDKVKLMRKFIMGLNLEVDYEEEAREMIREEDVLEEKAIEENKRRKEEMQNVKLHESRIVGERNMP